MRISDWSSDVCSADLVFAGDNSSLASVKAVSENYPLRGTIKLAAAPFEDGRDVHRVPAPGDAWADARLWPDLQLKPGATPQLGRLTPKLDGGLTDRHDRKSDG